MPGPREYIHTISRRFSHRETCVLPLCPVMATLFGIMPTSEAGWRDRSVPPGRIHTKTNDETRSAHALLQHSACACSFLCHRRLTIIGGGGESAHRSRFRRKEEGRGSRVAGNNGLASVTWNPDTSREMPATFVGRPIGLPQSKLAHVSAPEPFLPQ